jgi:intein/homing endonuclease
MNLPIEKIALDILKTYNGTNDYILQVQKEYFKNKSFVPTKKQSDYVIRFQNVNPHVVKKDIGIHKSCRQFVQEQLKLDFLPESIYIDKLLSRKDDLLHIWGCFGGDCGYYQTIFISKECLKKIKPLPPLNFEKYEREPKPHQIEAIEKLLQNEKFILADDMGLGKCLSINELVYTPKGLESISNLKVGDYVIGSNGFKTKVIGVYPQTELKKMYKITFNDGYSIKCTDDHIWTVTSSNGSINNKARKVRYTNLTVEEMLNKELILSQKGYGWNEKRPYKFTTYYKNKNGSSKWQIPIVKPIHFQNDYKLPIDPYLLGLGLGDGTFSNTNIRFQFHKDDFDELISKYIINENKPDGNKRSCVISIPDKLLVSLGLSDKRSHNKFIPDTYKYSSIEDRLSILQGLMDTDGHCMKSNNGVFTGTEYVTVSEQLANDVAEIVHSLGGIVRKRTKIGSYKKPDGTKLECKKSYSLNIKLPTEFNPFRLKRKSESYNTPQKYKVGRYIKSIDYIGMDKSICIKVDASDSLFTLKHGIVTHNTTSAIIAAMEGKFQKILVVCPASLKLNWKKEIMNYDSAENISIVDGVDFRVKKWTIVNYDILKNFHHLPERGVKISDLPTSPIDFHKFDLVIADEAHYLKTSTSNRTKIFNDFASRIPNRWLLTGTPITNKPVDFYNLLYLCESPIATNWMFYVRRYCAARQFNRKGTKQKYWVTSGASNLDELREYSSDCILRRTKKDSIDLPQKTIKPVYLPIELCTNYNSYIAEYEAWVEEMAEMGEKPTVTDHLVKLTKVRQLLSNDKIQHTISLAEDLIENGHKVIIFSCFTQSINAIHEHFGKTSVLIDGSVSKEKRQLAVDRFQSEDKVKVFCGNIVAAGVGLTLTEGSIVIFNDLDWTPANHAQAEDRAHRIGQVNDVHIIYPLFDETLDITMYNTLRKKMKIIGQVMGDAMFEDDDVSMGKDVIQSLTKS